MHRTDVSVFGRARTSDAALMAISRHPCLISRDCVAIFRETRNGSIRFRERKIGDVYCLRRPAFVLRPSRRSTSLRALPPTVTLRRVGCLLFCLHPRYHADSDKTSGPTATRGASHTARPLSLPRFLCSFIVPRIATLFNQLCFAIVVST